MRDIIRDGSGIEYLAEYTISYARFLLRSWDSPGRFRWDGT